jgi:phosphatidylethanolamine/phosphatidyl-N-methylethanolamine N-methyltransferase
MNKKYISELIEFFYADCYSQVHNKGLIGAFHNFIHRQIDNPIKNENNISIIEVGAGSGIHRRQTKVNWKSYVEVDIRETSNLAPLSDARPNRKFERITADATFLREIHDNRFDVLIATCLLAHMREPLTGLENWRRVVRTGGHLILYVPCEPGILLRILRVFTTRRLLKKKNLPYELILWNDHVNSWLRMDSLIRFIFRNDEIKRTFYPFFVPSFNSNLYVLYHIKITKFN